MRLSSVRARLALWHTVVLAVLLVACAAGAYAFAVHAVRARTDASLSDALLDLRMELLGEANPRTSTREVGREVLSDLRFRTIALVVFDSSERVVASAIPRPGRSASEDSEPPFDPARVVPLLRSAKATGSSAATVPDPEGGYRVAVARLHMHDGQFTIAAATSIHDDAEMLDQARLAMYIAIPVALGLAWGGGWLLARRSLAPMIDIRRATARIGASTLRERVPIADPDDEVGQLAAVINGLLDRLERAFAQQRQFMADASHELRTPVAVVQTEVTRALSRTARTPAEYEDALHVVRTAARRLRRIVDDLFLLARADAGELPVRHDPLYLDEVVTDCAREVRSLADARGVRIEVDAPRDATYNGDEALLHRLVINLLDNAIKHSPPRAAVGVRLRRSADTHGRPGDAYCLEVDNAGTPIPADLAPRIFDRFVRGDTARSREATDGSDALTSGAGLGLSIARWIAAAHGGTLELARSQESGTTFRLRLPPVSA